MSNPLSKILVTGANGHFGGLVLSHLIETYNYRSEQLIATSRKPEELGKWRELGVEIRKVDFDDPTTLTAAFQGAEVLLVVSTDSLDNEFRLRTHLNAVAAAKDAGVSHLVYTSMPQPDDSLVSFASVHLGTEEAIKASGLNSTILRNSWYFENLLFTLPGAIASGTLYSSSGDGKIAYISRSDLAQAAAASLINPASGVLTLTGSEALDISTVADRVSRKLDKPFEVVQVPEKALVEGMKSHGLPEFVATAFASFDAAAKAGNLAVMTSDFETLTGRKPKSFDAWFEDNKDLLNA